MAVTIAQAFSSITTGNPNGLEITVPTLTNGLLVFLSWDEDSVSNVINPFTLGGQTFTSSFNLEHDTELTQLWLHYWDHAAVAARANQNITFTDSQNISAYQYGFYEGVDQTTPVAEIDTEIAETSSDTITLTSTSTADDYLFALVNRNSGNRDVTDWDTLSEIGDVNPGTHRCASAHGVGGDASTILTGDGIADDWLAGMYRINNASAAVNTNIPVPEGPLR